ncbi:MAG: threonylcarbamoyl-AMP synthase [Alphaproteobacteria bacterium]|nr:threonylcarbamoyl-AMP synthase [Alphaproteobacteria bacterium]
MTRLVAASPAAIQEAAAAIREGRLVAFPTETVYGLGANALDGKAVARIFEAKGRPAFNPLISHVLDVVQAAEFGVLEGLARDVAAAFWPGPLTLLLPRREGCRLSDLVSAGLPTIALRAPAHKTARALIEASGVPIAAPSANKSGEISPTTPLHVKESLGDAVDMILADGPCKVGLESTVLDLTGDTPVVVRAGSVTAEDIASVIGSPVSYDIEAKENPRSPGQLLKHYAPCVPLRMNAIDLEPGEALLAFGSDKFMGIKGGGAASSLPEEMRLNLSEGYDLHEAAANLFRMMRTLDKPGIKGIAVMAIPDQGVGIAINDRLRRASAGANLPG